MVKRFTLDEVIGDKVVIRDEEVIETSAPTTYSFEEITNQEVAPQVAIKEPESGGIISKIGGAIKESFVGDAEFDLPELGTATPEDLGVAQSTVTNIAAGFLTEPTTAGRADILKANIPSITNDSFKFDKNDNVFVDLDGKKFYLNKPGLSQQDFTDMAAEVVKFLPGAKAAAAGTKGASLFTRATAQAGAAGSTELASQNVADLFGSEQDVDIGRVLSAAGFSAGGEVAFDVIGGIAKKVIGGKVLDKTERGALRKAGIDPDALDRETLIDIARTDVIPEKVRIAEASALPERIPQSSADITQNRMLRELETEAAQGRLGDKAGAFAQSFTEKQTAAIQKNVQILRSRISGDSSKSAAENSTFIQQKLINLKAKSGDAVAAAYDSARNLKATVPDNSASILKDKWIKSARENDFDVNIPEVANEIKKIDNLMAEIGAAKQSGAEIKINYSNFEKMRKSINNNVFAANDANRRRIAKHMKESIDELENDIVEGGLLSGSQDAITAAKNARAASAAHKRYFESNDIVNMLTKTARGEFGKGARLAVDADDAINVLFSKNSISKKGVTKDIKKLKEVLPENEFQAVKEAGFIKLLGTDINEAVSAIKFKKNLTKAFQDNPKLMQELYSKEELRSMRHFARIASRIEAKDFPKTPAMNNLAKNAGTTLTRFFGRPGAVMAGFLDFLTAGQLTSGRAAKAVQSFEGVLPSTSKGLGGAFGGQLGASQEDVLPDRLSKIPIADQELLRKNPELLPQFNKTHGEGAGELVIGK